MRHVNAPTGDSEDAEIRGVVEISEGCLSIFLSEVGERYPVVWPSGTSWDPVTQNVILASGDSIAAGDAVNGGGGYRVVEDIGQWAGPEAQAMAARCVDNTHREVAVVNNSVSGIGLAD